MSKVLGSFLTTYEKDSFKATNIRILATTWEEANKKVELHNKSADKKLYLTGGVTITTID